jgi:peptidyl-prolyl cis-trans isomerase SDCCAG10
MSQVYFTEPQTSGRVILETSAGAIDINLWCKECPTTTRAFLQLCLDGYYDNMIFHRIINDFLIQTGARRKSGKVDDETKVVEYMNKFVSTDVADIQRKKLEISPRIKFNHRGLVALALPLDQEVDDEEENVSLARQFFITMDEAPFLDKKYVIFGTIRGDTVFNALRIGKTETTDDKSGEVADLENAPTIKSVRIDYHTFDDLIASPESQIPWKAKSEKEETVRKKKKRKGKKDLNVLSFGGEMEDMDEGLQISLGMKSSHEDGKLDKGKVKKTEGKRKAPDNESESDHEEQKKTVEPLVKHTSVNTHISNLPEEKITPRETSSPMSCTVVKKSDQSRPNVSEKHTEEQPKSNISAVEARRQKYLSINGTKGNKRGSKARDHDTMAKLMSFKTKMFQVKGMKDDMKVNSNEKNNKDAPMDNSLASRLAKQLLEKADQKKSVPNNDAPVYSGQILEDHYDENDKTWLKGTFRCKRHIDHDSRENAVGGDKLDDYEVLNDSGRKRHK